ncbi:MAG: ABC transporter ATP-binding protein [Gammaproteobacteria bacterium]|nr:ABC transporter ATP-binding protein [Gammaproteobacteria bacterium]
MSHAIEIQGLTHRYGERSLYDKLTFNVPRGRVVALLGKNGVGKTTLIRILMGFLRPRGGACRVLGEDSHRLSPATRARIGLLFEGHLAYDMMSIAELERFYRAFYPRWRSELYYELVDRLALPYEHRIGNMSCGQRSQVVLGLIFAQDPELMILDDYSMGLDAGYRRLFLEYLEAFIGERERTVFLTSHVVQDMENLVDDVVFLQRGGAVLQTPLADFRRDFRCYAVEGAGSELLPAVADEFCTLDSRRGKPVIYSFASREELQARLQGERPGARLGEEIPMTLEDAFIGLTGKY